MGIESFTKKFTFPIPLFNKGMENVNFIIGSIITKKKNYVYNIFTTNFR